MNKKWKRYKTEPYVSGALVVINIIIFLWCTFDGGMLYNVGGLSPHMFFSERQYYRLLSSLFLHGDIGHLVNNMLLLFGLGAMMEKETGHLAFGAAYFISGVGGNIVSLLFKIRTGDWYIESIGASGAVFGLIGLLLMLGIFSGARMANVTPVRVLFVIGYSIYSNLDNSRIDNAAHVGGVVTGVMAGALICLILQYKKRTGGKGI